MKRKLIFILTCAMLATGCSAADSSDSETQQKITSKSESSSAAPVTDDSSSAEAVSSEDTDDIYTDISVDPYELEKQMSCANDGVDFEDWQDFDKTDNMRRSVWGKFYAEKTGLDINDFTPDVSDISDIEEGGCTAYLSFCSCFYKYKDVPFTLEIGITKYDDLQALYDAYYGDKESAGLKGGNAYIDGDVIVDEFDEYANGFLIMALNKNGYGLSVYTSSKQATLDDMKGFLKTIDF